MKHLLVVSIAIVVACGGGQKPGDGAAGTGGTGGGSGSGSAVVADGPITEAECDAYIGHVFDLSVADAQRAKPEDQRATPDEIAQARAAMIAKPELRAKCLAWTRATSACVMAATDLAALEPCLAE